MNETMGKPISRTTVVSNLIWKLMESFGTQCVQFIVQIVLARLLMPEDYGKIALIVIFITISNVFIQNGFNTALIQKKNADDIDFSSVFYLSTALAVFLYVVIFIAAPFIADYYNEPQLTHILRVLSITLFFNAITTVQNAVVSKSMQFKRFFFSSLGGIIISGLVGIIMAYLGMGVWSLVCQQLTNTVIITLVLWITVDWRPKLIFSFSRVKGLFKFGYKLLLSALIDTVYNNIYGLIIGKLFNTEVLGYYNRGGSIPDLLVTNINGSITSVLFPALSHSQDDKTRLKNMMRRSLVTSSYIVFPMMTGLIVCAEPLVRILLTDKWIGCVPFLQLLSITYALWPIHTANLQAINALGRSDVFLKLEIIKKIIGITALIISIPYGMLMMVYFRVITSVLSVIINTYPNRKLLNYTFKEQVQDIIPSLALSAVMGLMVNAVKYLGFSLPVTLAVQIIAGVIIYFGLSYVIKLESLFYLLDTAKSYINRKNAVQIPE